MPIDWTKNPNDMAGLSYEDKLEIIAEADEEIKSMRKRGFPKTETDRLQEISNKWYKRWEMESTPREVRYNNPAQ
jgi:hypothetical protein